MYRGLFTHPPVLFLDLGDHTAAVNIHIQALVDRSSFLLGVGLQGPVVSLC